MAVNRRLLDTKSTPDDAIRLVNGWGATPYGPERSWDGRALWLSCARPFSTRVPRLTLLTQRAFDSIEGHAAASLEGGHSTREQPRVCCPPVILAPETLSNDSALFLVDVSNTTTASSIQRAYR